jgi:pimeloyl-ACP methyl ester carboxylesterase
MSMSLIAVQATGADPKALAAAVRGAVARQIAPDSLLDVRVPVLVLNGSTDVANQTIERLLEVMPTARRGVCDGSHQSMPWEPSFHEAVVNFLKR